MQCPTNRLPESRNKLVSLFLAGAADWLFMVDTDMDDELQALAGRAGWAVAAVVHHSIK